MKSPHHDILEKAGRELVAKLVAAGFGARLVDRSYRQYSVKVAVSRGGKAFGNAGVFYSPKKGTLKVTTNEILSPEEGRRIEEAWSGKTAGAPAITPTSEAPELEAWIDGSWTKTGVGWAAVILKKGEVLAELSGRVDATDDATRQVAGELQAAREAVTWCRANGVASMTIHHDYTGVSMWAEGRWKAKQALTEAYAEFMQSPGVEIVWSKVKSHSGEKWNERADELARAASAKGAIL